MSIGLILFTIKYSELLIIIIVIFFLVDIEASFMNQLHAVDLVSEIGRRISSVTEDIRETRADVLETS